MCLGAMGEHNLPVLKDVVEAGPSDSCAGGRPCDQLGRVPLRCKRCSPCRPPQLTSQHTPVDPPPVDRSQLVPDRRILDVANEGDTNATLLRCLHLPPQPAHLRSRQRKRQRQPVLHAVGVDQQPLRGQAGAERRPSALNTSWDWPSISLEPSSQRCGQANIPLLPALTQTLGRSAGRRSEDARAEIRAATSAPRYDRRNCLQ